MESFWEPRAIVFDTKQVLWLLAWFLFLGEGSWPPDHRETGYTDAGKKKSHTRRAPFETAALVHAELDARINACGQDGEMLLAYYCYGMEAIRIAKLVKMDEERVMRRIRRALNYIASGPERRWYDTYDKDGELKRKAQTYQEFISHHKKQNLRKS